jgi:3-oxoacyl-[acyl-carrier-protein] synthase III
MGIVIRGTGSYFPARVVGNAEVEATTRYDARAKGMSLDAWARSHHGGVARHRAADGESTADLAYHAAGRALADAGLQATDLDLIVFATYTSDHALPPSASRLQARLGTSARTLQLHSACTGFVDAA